MKQKRFSWIGLLVTGLVSFFTAIILSLVLLVVLIGEEGMSVVETLTLVRYTFVGDYDYTQVVDETLDTLVDSLGDQWSYYADADTYESIQSSKSNSYVGIGITVSYTETELGLYIQRVTPDGPADLGGLTAGEVITAVDGVSLAGEMLSSGANLIQGVEHTEVTLEILSVDGSQRTVILVRSKIEDSPVSYQLLDSGIGLITINNFNSRCASEAIYAIDSLLIEGATGFIFDVRNNGGGYVDELLSLLDYILPEGAIFNSVNKWGISETVYSDADMVDLPMVVLINDNSYSAAELFAAELSEWDWAEVVGIPSTGKGYSQQLFALSHGGAVNLSTGAYTTGQGTCLAGVGLTPDHIVTLSEEDSTLLYADVLSPEEDAQIQAAVELLVEG